jgi:hypothetical protein
MSQPWYSFYLSPSDGIGEAIRALLTQQGFLPFDPFPGGTGTPNGLKETVRYFVAPAHDGWVRVFAAQPADHLLPDLSTALAQPVLYSWLTDQAGGMVLFAQGEDHDEAAAFEPYRRPNRTSEDMTKAFAGDLAVPAIESKEPPVAMIGLDSLPPELQERVKEKVNPKQANKLMDKLSGNIFNRLGKEAGESKDDQELAREMLAHATPQHDSWNSLNGQRLRAIASVLTLPDNWREPSFEALRAAYQVHRLRQRSPRMPLMPGDKEALQAVPDALDYQPIYMGR